ncbi:UPF0505 protein C16orf62 homolog isoform X2 [Agrilus planipennis]|uniref:UPF0505 protein C16orf62 homolog isoform X2 n=1 Tax=Agrilus planipennis TaxID=224129 RepID=A0A1W4XTH7_AGRPL|nr:UPF0505 protein C16orf62 homolog isoform X2 [Agrilus planipennis]
MNTTPTQWTTYIKNTNIYQPAIATEAFEHPLKSTTIDRIPRRILGSQPSTGRSSPIFTPSVFLEPLCSALEGVDPLSQFMKEEIDPLSQMAVELSTVDSIFDSEGNKRKISKSNLEIESWDSRKHSILSKYTTSEKLSIVTSFINEGERVVVKAQNMSVDKVQHRLEQLDYFEEGSQRKLDLTQAEYVNRIDQLNKELVSAWHSEHRVKALKIAIQCAKLLADTDVIQFYPSKFVLITDILDIFGQLVYERLRVKANYCKQGSKIVTVLPPDFTSDMVPESAKETCRNWFYKIASIRELIPRLYVEMAILKSYSFLTSSEFSAALLRLTRMIRGIGNPLVAAYARCYICRVGITVTTTSNSDSNYLKENFNDFLGCYNQLFSSFVQEELKIQRVPVATYLTLFMPALEFILQAVACTVPESVLVGILKQCEQIDNSALLINTIIVSFKPTFISVRAVEILEKIKRCIKQDFPVYILLSNLGYSINSCPPPAEHRKQILGDVWNIISQLGDPEQYINCAEIWIQYVVQYFSSRELNIILGNVIEHMSRKRIYENFYPQLKNVVQKVISFTQDFETLLAMDSFLPLIDLFQRENVKVEVCKSILITCISIQMQTSDPVITNSLIFLCSVLHDSINALTVDDERRQIAEILCNVVRRVDYGRDFEQQLSFYVEARGAFSNLDSVLTQLVQCVNTLATNTKRIVNGFHSKKTAAFVRACAAYCFITIPSIKSVHTRLELYLLSGRVALSNNCLGQADSFFKTILTTLSELYLETEEKPGNTDCFLISYINNLLSVLVVVPDSPDRGVLSLTKALLNILKNFNYKQIGTLAQIYVNVLDMLSTMVQESYPYHVDRGEILNQLKLIGPCNHQSSIAFELLLRIIIRGDMSKNSLSNLTQNLWLLSLKNGNLSTKYLAATKKHLEYYGKALNNPYLLETVEKLKF